MIDKNMYLELKDDKCHNIPVVNWYNFCKICSKIFNQLYTIIVFLYLKHKYIYDIKYLIQ